MKVLVRAGKQTVHEFKGRRRVQDILRALDMNPEAVIVIKGDRLLTSDAWVEPEDEIEVRPAISGG